MTPEEYIKQRLEPQIKWYDGKSSANKFRFIASRGIEIVAAATIPFLVGYASVEWIPPVIGVLGIIIALCAGAASLLQLQEHWIELGRHPDR
jgi:hypothetical protein